MNEKEWVGLVRRSINSPYSRPLGKTTGWKQVITALVVLVVVLLTYPKFIAPSTIKLYRPKYEPECPTQEVIKPVSYPEITAHNVDIVFKSEAFRNLSIERLSGAVRIPTEDFDDMGIVGEDDRWDIFYELEKYFRETFPLLHEKLELEIVNSHALVYTWRGSDSGLQPILLTGHQDVSTFYSMKKAVSIFMGTGCSSSS
jgi:hypothetical protein